LLRVRDQLRLLVEGVADEGDDVGEEALAGAFDLVAVEGFVSAPEELRGPGAGRGLDRRRQGLDVLVAESLAVGLAVEELKRLDLVAVRSQELLERLGQRPRPLLRLLRGPGEQQLVLGDLVQELLVLPPEIEQRAP
jgi:hypothetical protein